MKKLILSLASVAAISVSSFAAMANEAINAGNLEITMPWTRATLDGQPAAGGFLTIENKGAEADKLISVSSPLTPMTQVHEMKMDGDTMKMSELPNGLDIPAGAKVELKPGSYHIMFMGLKSGIKEGDAVKVTLKFEKAGELEVELPAQAAGTKEMMHQHGG